MAKSPLRNNFTSLMFRYLALLGFLLLSAGSHLFANGVEDSSKPDWTFTGPLITARIGHTATLLPKGQVLIVGGHGVAEDLGTVELYDLKKGTFEKADDLQTGRTNHTATLLPDGRVLIVGGQFQGNTLASAEIFDPTTGLWSSTGKLHAARSYHTATLLANGQVLVAGGVRLASPPVYAQGAPPDSALDITEVYDPETGVWTITDSMRIPRYVHTATRLKNGRVLVTGGIGSHGDRGALDSAEVYNPETQKWESAGKLPRPFFNHSATLLENGQVLVAGGQMNGVMLDDATLYDSSRNLWVPTASLPVKTNGHSATLMPDGHVLVLGGANDSGVLRDAESYDPIRKIWETLSPMNRSHGIHTATLLPNGQVLVAAGGYAVGLPSFVQTTAELYSRPSIKSDLGEYSLAPANPVRHLFSDSHFITMTACLLVITFCCVIITLCVLTLFCVWLAFLLAQQLRKSRSEK